MTDIKLLTKYFPNLTEIQKTQFQKAVDAYIVWNAQINVVSRKDMENIVEKHFLHSLGIAKVCQFTSGTEILDVGTGGGFPGIPLAILFPDVQFHLVDSIGKKIKVVDEVVAAVGLENVTSQHERAQNVDGYYDFVISRAVTRMQPFLEWIKGKVNKNQFNKIDNGTLYLKGGDLTEELAETERKYKVYGLDKYFKEEFFETKKVVHLPL
ncbi:MAG: 16S rRNA (guanine527-N7)-methyltransferase [Spirosomataceae bacterium]|jgi:16S rRNA (guanine527-N7)-methyltransferase